MIKIYFSLGLVALILAIIGIILPLLPTTPFALLAIYFFDRSSPKFHGWCMKIPGIGDSIEDWNKHKVIGKKAKIQASILIIISAIIVILKPELSVNIKVLTLCVLSVVITFLLTRPSLAK